MNATTTTLAAFAARALAALALNPDTRAYLAAHDPQALAQADAVLGERGAWDLRVHGSRNATRVTGTYAEALTTAATLAPSPADVTVEAYVGPR